MDKKNHWEDVYKNKSATEVSWFQEKSEMSLRLIDNTGLGPFAAVIDVGGGASSLVDDLLDKGYQDITVLDISAASLAVAHERLGSQASQVAWLEADITQADLEPLRYDIWHDRAVFHFLTLPEDRCKYVETMRLAVKPGGHVVISTFDLDGPMQCSGLEIVRYSSDSLHRELGEDLELVEAAKETHRTPWGSEQEFTCCRFHLP